jgi:hypothetical protein
LRRLADFIVRNGEWLRPYILSAAEKEAWLDGKLNPDFIVVDDSIWTVARRYPKSSVIQLINFSGLSPHQRWNEPHSAPTPCKNVLITIQTTQRPEGIFWDCPEQAGERTELSFEYADGTLNFQIPQIHFLGLVVIYE